MSYWTLIFVVFVADLVAVLSPGPDFVLTIRNTLRGSRACGVATGLGIASGIAVHVAYCWVGFAVLLSGSETISAILTWLGAGYLIWLGVSGLLAKSSDAEGDAEDAVRAGRPTPRSSFLNGFLTNLFNPKAFLFYISLYAVVLEPDTPFWVYAMLAVLFVSSSIVWFTALAFLADTPFIRTKYEGYEALINRVFSLLLIALGLGVAAL